MSDANNGRIYVKAELDIDQMVSELTKSNAAFATAQIGIDGYVEKLGTAHDTAGKLTDKIAELNELLGETSFGGLSGEFNLNFSGGEGGSDVLGGIIKTVGEGYASAAGGAIFEELTEDAVENAVSSLSSLASSFGIAGVAALGATVAIAYGAYALYDYASGAKATREALEDLNNHAKQWNETDITTSFEKSGGMSEFGLTSDDFTVLISNSRTWMDELTRVFAGGEEQTTGIIRDMVAGFTDESDVLRDGLENIQQYASSGGFTGDGFLAGLDTDLARLNEIDQEIAGLLAGNQEGSLNLDDLNALYQERDDIEIKYRLQPIEENGFGNIVENVESALSRNANPMDTWADAYTAASQGLQAYNDALNAEYDTQYALIGLLDGPEQEQAAAMTALKNWYNEQSTKGLQQYNDALTQTSELTSNAFSDGGAYGETADLLSTIRQQMNDGETKGLAESLSQLDETQVVELTAALVSMQAAAEGTGTGMGESAKAVLGDIEFIKQALGADGGLDESLMSSLNAMFGEGLDSEVLEVYASMNAESLEKSYLAWAEGEHAPIIQMLATGQQETDPPVEKLKFSNSTNPELEYNRAVQKITTEGDNGDKSKPFADSVNNYAENAKKLKAAKSELGGFEIGTDDFETAQATVSELEQLLEKNSKAMWHFAMQGEVVESSCQYITSGLQLLAEGELPEEDASNLLAYIDNISTMLKGLEGSGNFPGAVSLFAELFTGQGWEGLEGLDPSLMSTALITALEVAAAGATEASLLTGDYVGAGVGEGVSTHNFDEAANTSANNLETSTRNSLQENSPSQLMVPHGMNGCLFSLVGRQCTGKVDIYQFRIHCRAALDGHVMRCQLQSGPQGFSKPSLLEAREIL